MREVRRSLVRDALSKVYGIDLVTASLCSSGEINEIFLKPLGLLCASGGSVSMVRTLRPPHSVAVLPEEPNIETCKNDVYRRGSVTYIIFPASIEFQTQKGVPRSLHLTVTVPWTIITISVSP